MLEDRVMRTFKDTNLEWLEFTGVNYSNVRDSLNKKDNLKNTIK